MRIDGHLGHIEFDGRVVTIHKNLRGAVSVPVSKVGGVSIIPAGIGMRAIRFAVSGGTSAGEIGVGGSHSQAAQDPYALTFRKKHLGQFEQLRNDVLAASS